jgi:hypothetical protein
MTKTNSKTTATKTNSKTVIANESPEAKKARKREEHRLYMAARRAARRARKAHAETVGAIDGVTMPVWISMERYHAWNLGEVQAVASDDRLAEISVEDEDGETVEAEESFAEIEAVEAAGALY